MFGASHKIIVLKFCVCANHKSMDRYVYVLFAYSPLDGGYVRMLNFACGTHWASYEEAEQFITIMRPLHARAGDYRFIEIRKTIAF